MGRTSFPHKMRTVPSALSLLRRRAVKFRVAQKEELWPGRLQSRATAGPRTSTAVSGTSGKKGGGHWQGCTVWSLQIHLSPLEALHPQWAFLTTVWGLSSSLEEELVQWREEQNPGDLFLGVVMRDGEEVRGSSCLMWTPVLSLLGKELGGRKTQHLNLCIVFLFEEGEEREKRHKRR